MIIRNIILSVLPAVTIMASAQDISSVLRQIETNNIELKALAVDNEATAADLAAENALGGPSAEFSPFWQKGVDGMSSSELIVSQEFDFPTLYGARRKAAGLEMEAANRRYDVARQELLLQAKLKCLELARLHTEYGYLSARHEYSHEILRLLAKREEEGGASALDVNKTRLQHMSLEADLARNEASRRALVDELTVLNGGLPLGLDSLNYPAEDILPPFETLRSRLIESDPALAEARAEIAAAGQGVAVSRMSWLPSINAGYRRNTAPGEAQNGMLIGLSFPVWSNSSRIRAARARRTAAEMRADDATVRAEGELKSRYDELTDLRRVIDSYDTALMTESLRLLNKSVETGHISVLEYYTESDLIYEKLSELSEARYTYHTILANMTRSEL